MKNIIVILTVLLWSTPSIAQESIPWVGTWASAAEWAGGSDLPKTNLVNNSLRQVVQVSLGGNELQLQLSNEFSKEPLEIRSVYIADASDSSSIDPKTARYLTFGGRKSVAIEAGKALYSDACKYSLRPLQRLSITICYGGKVPENITSHRGSRTTSYIYKGVLKPRQESQTIETQNHWYNITKINVRSDACAIAILGNSITDGRGSTTNAQNRWPDFMAKTLEGRVGVLNLGIGGNCVVEGGISEPALKRFDRDILGQEGVDRVIIFEGTNDIGISTGNYEHVADTLIAAYKILIRKAHERGLFVYGATITPTNGNGWYSPFHEAIRQTVNEWIKTSGCFDGVIDFDSLVRNPRKPIRLKDEFSDDWLHLNPAGYEAMGKFAAEQISKKHKN